MGLEWVPILFFFANPYTLVTVILVVIDIIRHRNDNK